MGTRNFVSDKSFGYCQVPSATVDAGTNLATYVFANTPSLAGLTTGDGPWRFLVIAEAQGFRFRDDSTAATAAVGTPIAVGQPLEYDADGLSSLTVRSQVAGCILNVTIFRLRF